MEKFFRSYESKLGIALCSFGAGAGVLLGEPSPLPVGAVTILTVFWLSSIFFIHQGINHLKKRVLHRTIALCLFSSGVGVMLSKASPLPLGVASILIILWIFSMIFTRLAISRT